MRSRHCVIAGITIAFTITFLVLGPSQGHIAEYFLTDEQFEDIILNDDNADRYSTYDKSLTIKFSPLNLKDMELSFDWCTKNNGFWNDDDSTCYFETQKDHDNGIMALDQYAEMMFGVEKTDGIVSFDDPIYSVPFGSSDDEHSISPVYIENPDNSGELILDIDAMQLVQKILKDCDSPKYDEFAYGLEYSNGTHYIDTNNCEWEYVGPATNSINKWGDAPIYKEQKEN